MVDPAEIARGLTKAQREAITYPESYADPNTVRSLKRRGLWKTDIAAFIRQHIKEADVAA